MKYFILIFLLILLAGSGIYYFLNEKKNSISGSPAFENVTPTKTEKTVSFKIYLGKKDNSREGEDCKPYSPVSRETRETIALEKEALEELLRGPSVSEIEEGYYSSINKGVKLQSLIIEGGKAKADFSAEIETGVGGSCMVLFIRQQIVKTLMEFPGIKEVVISVNGRTEDILQP